MMENYDNFLSELGYKRKPKSFQVKKTKKKINVKTPEESISFYFGTSTWIRTNRWTSRWFVPTSIWNKLNINTL